MAEVIASTYELIGILGSGGGGTAYLAYHNRLKKKVVLKADKRKSTTKPELLRREVDVLKNLNHPNIPQVYDYFVEDGVVYTVMDYIEGESLDKVLKRERHFEQPTVIKWSIQLLEALCYLHSETHGDPPKGYVHGDIKPANIMLKPDGNICLIDFNISLALGEQRLVGGSAGYASPEHYGLDYSYVSGKNTVADNKTEERTEVLVKNNDSTEVLDVKRDTASRTTGSPKKLIVPDVRSDIYSLGATVYHLLSGRRPEKNAIDVVSLSKKEYSEAIVNIISKAMMPSPDMRYQSAEAMLEALLNLRKRDPRTRQLKNISISTLILTITMLSIGIIFTFIGLRRMQLREQWMKLIEYADNAYENGDTRQALEDILTIYQERRNFLTPPTPPEAQRELTKILGVYDLADKYEGTCTVELPSAVLSMRISPEGKTALCVVQGNLEILDLEKGEVIKELPMDESALAEAEYADEDHIIYAGIGGITVYGIVEDEILWQGKPATAIAVSEDGSRVAGIYKDESEATLYQVADGKVLREIDFEDRFQEIATNDRFINPNHNLFELNDDGSRMVVSFADGSLSLLKMDSDASKEDIDIFDHTSGYYHFEGGFCSNYLAFSASNESESVFAVLDMDTMTQTGGFQSDEDCFSVIADRKGIRVCEYNLLVNLNPETGEQIPLVNTTQKINAFSNDDFHTVINTPEGVYFFDGNGKEILSTLKKIQEDKVVLADKEAVLGNHDSPVVNLLRLNNHDENELCKYDSGFLHDELRLSADEKTFVLFSYNHFRVYKMDGTLAAEADIPDGEQVYDQQFQRQDDRSWLEVIYYDGTVTRYDAANGKILDTVVKEKPNPDLYEEFETTSLRIESPLHGTPKVYSRDTDKLVAELDPNAYLTYVTEADQYMIAQYISTDGMYYGHLMNENCEVLADLPYLCDVKDGQLIFDYPTGDIRATNIYPLDDLINLAKEKVN